MRGAPASRRAERFVVFRAKAREETKCKATEPAYAIVVAMMLCEVEHRCGRRAKTGAEGINRRQLLAPEGDLESRRVSLKMATLMFRYLRSNLALDFSGV